MAREVQRININVPLDTLEKIDAYADRMTINRTAAILVLVNEALDARSNMSTLQEMLDMFKANGVEF